MIPQKYAPGMFALILSGLMSLLVSGISAFRLTGMEEGFIDIWRGAWLASWSIAFPAVLVIAPLARRMVARLTAP